VIEFKEWPKIPRLNKNITVTEKIDGTNACVIVTEDGQVAAQSRTRIITPDNDNYGFAKWVAANATELVKLGPGYHYGEWWGQGIQRRYGLEEKRFSLFNTGRWADVHGTNEAIGYRAKQEFAPACCYVVPVLGVSNKPHVIDACVRHLRAHGSVAAWGFEKPEGVCVYLNGHYYKVLLENDDIPKSAIA
jgi:hypothetical protein